MLYNVSRPEEPIRDKMLNLPYTTRGNVKITKNPNRLSKNFHFIFRKDRMIYSLLLRRNLTSVSHICKAAPITLLWAPNGLNE